MKEACANHGQSYNDKVVREVGVRLEVALSGPWSALKVVGALTKQQGEDLLDVVDCVLWVCDQQLFGVDSQGLEELLDQAGSVWCVSDDASELQRRVSDELAETVKLATTPEDEASNELRLAWSNAYGRNGSASYAWTHAVKALEALLLQEVCPNQAKGNLGHVVGELKKTEGNKWRSSFPGKEKDHSTLALAATLELVWPNPDRHSEPNPQPPTDEEARSVVALTAALVQAHRETSLVYKVP